MAHKQRTAAACSLSCRSLRSQFRTGNAGTEGVTMFNKRRSAVLKLAGSLFWDFHFQIRLLCLSDYAQLSDLYGHVNRQTDPHHYGNSSLICTPQCTASSALNLQLQSKLIKQRHKQKSSDNNAGFLISFLSVRSHWASHRLPASLKWTEAAEVSFHSATNVSWPQLWACGVNPPWQDCWDGSASTATLAGSVCLAIHTATKLAWRGSSNQDAAKVTARARSSFALCRYGCCILFLFSWEMRLTEGEKSDRGMEKRVQRLSADHACAA